MIQLIVGTRPEALKALPLIRELKRRKVHFEVVATGQHTDLLRGTGLQPDVSLDLASENDPLAYVDVARDVLFPHVARASIVVVIGDTATAVAGCRAAVGRGIPVAHVEAGLRSHDLADPWPEELFRVEIDRHAQYRFCPTESNGQNLVVEGVGQYNVTGNTIVDALAHLGLERRQLTHVLITLHRRESFGEPMRNILWGLSQVAQRAPMTPFLWPVHPNPKVMEAIRAVRLPPNVMLRSPLHYHDFLEFLRTARCVLTDSGGVIEESCTLGIPCVIARDHTERPESVAAGSAVLAGRRASGVWEGLDWGMKAEIEPSATFGDGQASSRIADILA